MPTSLPDGNRTRRLALASAFLTAALMLSLAEALAIPGGILPIPGAKPGLANAAILVCATIMGRRYAAAVSLCRIIVMFILFGNGTSVIYSLSGAAVSFIGIILLCSDKRLSFFGKSVVCAVLHNVAQSLCAMVLLGLPAIMLIPWMILSGALCGGFTGIIINLSYKPIFKASRRFALNTRENSGV